MYPASLSARDRFILERRPARPPHDPWRAHGVVVEQEPDASGALVDVVTVFLTGRECPWRCAMCDLWTYTLTEDTPAGAIPHQIREALGGGATVREWHVKLYNAGSFFDSRAVPPADYPAIAAAVAGASRVIVESHPSLVGPRLHEWLDVLRQATPGRAPALEVGMGLETANPIALERLNKRMTTGQFAAAAAALGDAGARMRAFLLVSPPFVPQAAQRDWLERSVEFAFACGATAVSLIPSRAGNGTMEALAAAGEFVRPTLDDVEDAMDLALTRAAGRVFADLWELDHLASCDACFAGRKARLAAMNLTQRPAPRIVCPVCAAAGMGA